MTVMDTPVKATQETWLEPVRSALLEHKLVPYLGPGMLGLIPDAPVPGTPEALVALLVAKATVPHKIRNRLTQAAQFIENFKHRKTVVHLMNEAFAAAPVPSALHLWLAEQSPRLPLMVEGWYDDTLTAAMRLVLGPNRWGEVQGLAQSEHFGTWTAFYDGKGQLAESFDPQWQSLVYRPIGGHAPAGNYLVSDSDYVEVLTEIDIQTPIPAEVQQLRAGKHFLFLGCRFNDQLSRSFARQIMKRSSQQHWAVLPEPPTRMEARFLEEQHITRIDCSLAEAAQLLCAA